MLAAIEVVASVSASESPRGIGVRPDVVEDGATHQVFLDTGALDDGEDLAFPRARRCQHDHAGGDTGRVKTLLDESQLATGQGVVDELAAHRFGGRELPNEGGGAVLLSCLGGVHSAG